MSPRRRLGSSRPADDERRPATGADGAPGAPRSVWDMLTGRVAKITATLGVVTALLVAATNFMGALPPLGQTFKRVVGIRGPQVTVDARAVERVPGSLIHLLPSQDRLHWLVVRVNNGTSEPVFFSVGFEVAAGPAVIEKGRVAPEYTVQPGKERTETFDPPLEFTGSFDTDVLVRIVTRVVRLRGQNDILYTDTKEVRVLRRELLAWDLVDHVGKPVSTDFTLASLVAWVNADETIRRRAELIRKDAGAPGEDFVMRWWRASYTTLFRGPDRLRVTKQIVKLPGKGSIILHLPAEVLAQKQASPLEAALVLHALRSTLPAAERGRLLLLAVPRAAAADDQTLLLAWRYRHEWHAIDLRRAGEVDFDANIEEQTARVQDLFTGSNAVPAKLDDTGVLVDSERAMVAMDLARAARHFFNLGSR